MNFGILHVKIIIHHSAFAQNVDIASLHHSVVIGTKRIPRPSLKRCSTVVVCRKWYWVGDAKYSPNAALLYNVYRMAF